LGILTITEILIVDDDQSLLESMLQGIRGNSSSLNVLTAINGLQALTILKKHCVRLIVTDLRMPEMDGFELLTNVMDTYPDIPVILTTGHSIPESKRDIVKQGALDVMFKPFALKSLRERVNTIIEKQTDGGTLNNVSPAMFLQLVHMEQKTCTVRVHGQTSGNLGVLFFRNGELLDARMNDLQGETATLEIFSWDHISLSIQNECPVNDLKINRSLNGLILEASRIQDERSGSGPSIAAPDAIEDTEKLKPAAVSDPNEHLSMMKKRLASEPDLNCHVKALSLDEKWLDLLPPIRGIGDLLNAGELKAIGIRDNADGDHVIFPTTPPTLLTVDAQCKKERFYSLLD
jgi:CheY-like chemotaxis protein